MESVDMPIRAQAILSASNESITGGGASALHPIHYRLLPPTLLDLRVINVVACRWANDVEHVSDESECRSIRYVSSVISIGHRLFFYPCCISDDYSNFIKLFFILYDDNARLDSIIIQIFD